VSFIAPMNLWTQSLVVTNSISDADVVVSTNNFVAAMGTTVAASAAVTLRPNGRLQYGGTVTGGRRVAIA
jgi:hypothetical protein